MTYSEAQKINKESLKYDNTKVVAAGYLYFKDGSGKKFQHWTKRDLFQKDAFFANYEITHTF